MRDREFFCLARCLASRFAASSAGGRLRPTTRLQQRQAASRRSSFRPDPAIHRLVPHGTGLRSHRRAERDDSRHRRSEWRGERPHRAAERYDAQGFRFFTNYESDKALAIAANPQIALLFHWPPFERQVSVQGIAEKTSREESDAYFQKRPLASRLGAWASLQSRPLTSREALEAAYAALEIKYADGKVPLPPHWGGYLVRPTSIEFWQGRRSRLHDRFRYTRTNEGLWNVDRLSP